MRAVALLLLTITVAQPASVDAVLARLDGYLKAYEPRLSELIADETMDQDVRLPAMLQPTDLYRGRRETRLRRQITSEVAFIALPANAGWLGFRHVKTVNTRPVELAGMSLLSSLTTQGYESARSLLAASAEHNLGLPRTTNLPNLPLEFLHERNRKRLVHRADGQESVRGIRTSRIVLIEAMTPTLIQNPESGGDMPSVVRAWIDPNGRLLRAEVQTFASARSNTFENSIRVEFVENKTLAMLVPIEMREVFAVERPGTGTSVARYSNFRRFQTSARIVPQ